MNIGTLVGSREGFWTGPPKWRQRFYRECKENIWAPCRGRLHRPLGAAVPPPLFTSNKREVSLDGGNRGIQKCDSIDPLSLVIKCLGGGGYEYESGDLVVPIIDKQPSPSVGQVNTHTHLFKILCRAEVVTSLRKSVTATSGLLSSGCRPHTSSI
jgi:hypothetical protein